MNKTELKAELKKLGLVEGKDYPKGAESSVESLEKLLAKAEKADDKKAKKEEGKDKEPGEKKEDDKTGDDQGDGGPVEKPEENKDETKYGPQLKKNSFKYDGEGSIDIIRGNRYIRTYHEEAHGKDFKEKAQDFINKNTVIIENEKTGKKTKKCPFTMTNTENVTKLFVDYEKINKRGKIEKVRKEFKGSILEKEKACQLAAEENKSMIIG